MGSFVEFMMGSSMKRYGYRYNEQRDGMGLERRRNVYFENFGLSSNVDGICMVHEVA